MRGNYLCILAQQTSIDPRSGTPASRISLLVSCTVLRRAPSLAPLSSWGPSYQPRNPGFRPCGPRMAGWRARAHGAGDVFRRFHIRGDK